MFKKAIKSLMIIAALGYIGFCLTVYFIPHLFFYNPSHQVSNLANAQANGFPATEVKYTAADGTDLLGWFVKPQDGKKIIIYFHGNSYNIEAFYHKLLPFIESGYGAFIGEYRGFGGLKGVPSQQGLAQDAAAAIDWLKEQGYNARDMVAYGMSMGSFTSVDVVAISEEPFAGMILEVPFDNICEVVKQRIWPVFPFQLILRDCYDNLAKIKTINIPILVMAAEYDKTVPNERAKNLFTAANEPKEFILYRGAQHSNLYNYRNWRDILRWLKQYEKNK